MDKIRQGQTWWTTPVFTPQSRGLPFQNHYVSAILPCFIVKVRQNEIQFKIAGWGNDGYVYTNNEKFFRWSKRRTRGQAVRRANIMLMDFNNK